MNTATAQQTVQQTPEELLRFLDLQRASRRLRRASSRGNRVLFLVGGTLFISLAAAAALFVLQQMLSNLPAGSNGASLPGTAEHRVSAE